MVSVPIQNHDKLENVFIKNLNLRPIYKDNTFSRCEGFDNEFFPLGMSLNFDNERVQDTQVGSWVL